jgi:cytochrome P450
MARARLDLPTLLADPLDAFAKARSVGWLADADVGGLGVLTHERVRELLTDGRLRENFVDFMETFGVTSGAFYEWMKISPLNQDGPDHIRWRQLMSKAFTPRSVERLRPFLETAAHELIDGFIDRGEAEFVSTASGGGRTPSASASARSRWPPASGRSTMR